MGLSKRIFMEEVERAQYHIELMQRATVGEVLAAMRRHSKRRQNENASKVSGITPTSEN